MCWAQKVRVRARDARRARDDDARDDDARERANAGAQRLTERRRYRAMIDAATVDTASLRAILGEENDGDDGGTPPTRYDAPVDDAFDEPVFGTPDSGERAARGRAGVGTREDDAARERWPLADVKMDPSNQAGPSTTIEGRYDPEEGERRCREAAECVLEVRRHVARARAANRATASASAYATPTPSRSKKTPATPTTIEREQKGLRHFSMRVCEKVEQKKHTSYNEVADELVDELREAATQNDSKFDEKNVRRRVYDALNVLTAVDIITKKKKEIFWNGYPPGYVKPGESPPRDPSGAGPSSRGTPMETHASDAMVDELERKNEQLAELVEQHDAIVALIRRNKEALERDDPPPTGIQLPFVLIQTRQDAEVDVEISDDQRKVHFDFNQTPFQIHDGFHVLTKMINLHERRIPPPTNDRDSTMATTAAGTAGTAVVEAAAMTPPNQRKTPTKRQAPTKSPARGKRAKK